MGLVQTDTPWSWPRKLAFRFLLSYFVLYIVPFPLEEMGRFEWLLRRQISGPAAMNPMNPPYLAVAAGWYRDAWNKIVPWVGENILHLSDRITIGPNGSGDTTWNYVQVFSFAGLALAAAVLWSLCDWRTTNYARLRGALRIYVRYYLATQMIIYGTIKVVPSQFPPPALDRLVQPFGDASPMGLLWTFMGASPAYEIFSGSGELLGGLLLTMRRTTLLGALVSMAVLTQIVALNYCYDVPVKLFSTHLLVMSLWLIGPDFRRLMNVLLLHGASGSQPIGGLVRWWWLDWTLVALRTLIVGGYVYLQITSAYSMSQYYAGEKQRSPFYGVWTVEEFSVDGKDRPALVTEPNRWRRFIVDYPGTAAVQLTDASRVRFRVQLDSTENLMTLRRPDFSDWKAQLTYSWPDSDHLMLEGKFEGHDLRAKLAREDLDQFLAQFRLTTRGFHWINEYPFNR
jgi:hypothetical protein